MDKKIEQLLKDKKPLPYGTELQDKQGNWIPLSGVAMEAANRPSYHYGGDPAWTQSWHDLIPRLRVRK